MGLFDGFRRRRLRRVADELGLALRQRFGPQPYYRPADVYSTAALIGLAAPLLGYGLALWCTREDFEAASHGLPGAHDYDHLRTELEPFRDADFRRDAAGQWAGINGPGDGQFAEDSDAGGHGDSGSDGGGDGGSGGD